MGEVCVDYLDSYRKFFDRFSSSVDPSDQLPVKVAGYNLLECEVAGAVSDWSLQYLEQRRCPPFLIAHLVRKVIEEVRVLCKIDPISCGFRGEVGDYLSLKLMQICIAKLVDVCSRYRDNAELSSLPPPNPLPPVTSCAIKNSRRSMEDRHVVIHDFHTLFNIKGWGPASYYGVLDGHNGIDAAIYSVSHLHQFLAESPHYPSNPVKALRDACCKTDDLFTIKAQRENLHGGTTAVVALLRPMESKLYVAWIGDSQAVLVRQGRPIQIVRPHKPDRTDEKDRIEGMGGAVLYWGAWRVNGQLAVSRAIGDVEYKPYVTAEPDIEEITLDGSEDFLILACDGLWDFVSEQEATNAVFKQLQENPEDLEAVSHRLVVLSKEQSSQDNISVVVVFLADPAELAKRPPMETASPNPFNGAEIFNGQPHHRAPAHPFDDEDFGPETDVDMVDDVLLSPAIAAAKALVHGATEDDYERQRQQMKEFDDPGDFERSRDTPTPPAHEVARDASADNLAESGGEESEEEWNYIPGKDTENQASAEAEADSKDQEDMSSQLNPNAAEFVPVSPTRLGLLKMDDTTISGSPCRGFEKSLDDIELPSELEFLNEISQRPDGPKHGDDIFMREDFSSLLNKSNEFNVSSECSELANKSVLNFANENPQEHVPCDKLAAVQNIEEKVTSGVLEKANIFGTNDNFTNNAFEATNIFGKGDPMTTSFMGKDFVTTPETEEDLVPGTPRSTTVEAPGSPTPEGFLPSNHQTELDSPGDDFAADMQKSPDLISPGDGPQEGLTSGQERTSSSGFESESGAEEVEPNVATGIDGFITEHRRSPPLDLTFKPIQTFSDTNPFGALQTPSSTTPMDNFDIPVESQKEPQFETPKKDADAEKPVDQIEFKSNTPSFITRRSPVEETVVPFEELESPKELPHFAHPPNANSSILATELPESLENQDDFDTLSPVKSEPAEPSVSTNYEKNVNDITQNLFPDDTNPHVEHDVNTSCGVTNVDVTTKNLVFDDTVPKVEETSFTTDIAEASDMTHVDLNTTEEVSTVESKITKVENEGEEISKLDKDLKADSDHYHAEKDVISSSVSPKAVEQVLAAFDEIKEQHEVETVHGEDRDSDIEVETKEMKLEFESHIADSQTTPEELKNLEEGFEVLSKDELTQSNYAADEAHKDVESHDSSVIIVEKETEIIDLTSPITETNPFKMDDDITANKSLFVNQEIPDFIENGTNKDFLGAVDQFSAAVEEDLVSSEKLAPLSSQQEAHSPVEPEATKTVSYQTLTPADEPQITKMESYITGKEEKTESSLPEEIIPEVTESIETSSPVEEIEPIGKQEVTPSQLEIVSPVVLESVQKSEPVQSTVVTETLITALEETSEVPSIATTEVPSRTPPPTPAPGLNDSKEFEDNSKTDILVAAVAAAGAVAAGSAVIAEKEVKKVKETATAKKSTISATKTSSDISAKPSAKQTTTKAAAAKPAGTKTTASTTKAASAPTKSVTATTTTTTKSAPAKTAATNLAAKKPIAAAPGKPVASKTTTSTTSKLTTASSKPVPKQLPVNKTTPGSLKPPSKPSTPTSKPTTPTTPKSPMGKSDLVKSPPRPGLKTTLTAKTASPKPATDKSAEKKPLTNGDIKPITKKTEVPKKPPTTTTKPTSAKPAVSSTKTTGVAKSPLLTANKTAAPKPAAGSTAKPKPAPAAPTSVLAANKRSSVTKETANRLISSAKPTMNGKSATTKPASGVKKTDSKTAAKTGTKPPPIKKPEAVKKEEEKPAQIQEGDVTTTNGYTDHFDEQEGVKIEDLAQVIV